MSSMSFTVGASNVCRYVVLVAYNQFLSLLTFVSVNAVCDNDDIRAKTRNICQRLHVVDGS